MELKLKYQYTYFIKPFIIKEKEYKKYLYFLLNNKNCKLKIFEKEKDYNLYTYFAKEVREYFFGTFGFDKNKINYFEKIDNISKSKMLSKFHCNIFEYNFKTKVQGKVNKNDGIFFNIEKIEIICFDNGICFLNIKTDIENSEKFSDLLNFNYRLKDINSGLNELKNFTNIKIQTDKFSSMKKFSDFINDIIGVNNNSIELKSIDLYNQRFFTYTYSCIDQDNWSEEEDFEKLKSDFLRYSNVLSSNNNIDLSSEEFNKNIKIFEGYKYSRFGFTKHSSSLMASSIDINNYTKLSFEYENEYFYTLIISLFQRIYLKRIEISLKNKKNFKKARKDFVKYTKELWTNEITNSVIGTALYNKWKEVFEFEDIYNIIKTEYDVMYKEFNIEKSKMINKVILLALGISLLLNIVNFVVLTKRL